MLNGGGKVLALIWVSSMLAACVQTQPIFNVDNRPIPVVAQKLSLEDIQQNVMLAGAPRVDEPFDDPDREVAAAFIRQCHKPCLAYKILGAGRKCDSPAMVRDAFEFAFKRIKPGDAVVVGMFQKHADQVADDVRIVREICAKR